MFRSAIPEGHDVCIIAHVLHTISPEHILEVFTNLRKNMTPGSGPTVPRITRLSPILLPLPFALIIADIHAHPNRTATRLARNHRPRIAEMSGPAWELAAPVEVRPSLIMPELC
jgi:hypothetical protein